MPSEEGTPIFKSAYRDFATELTIDALLACGAGIFTVGVTSEMVLACRSLIERLQKDGARWTSVNLPAARSTSWRYLSSQLGSSCHKTDAES